MKIQTKIIVAVVALSAATIVVPGYFTEATGSTSAAPAGRTGSPGDGLSCTSCHSGTASTEAGLITSDIPAGGYIPGQTYTITGTVSMAGKTKFGFQISPQNTSGVQLGTMTLIDPTKTSLVGSGKYVTHKTAGTSFPGGTATWSFNWTAPALGTGTVTFYGAFNITNANGSSSGDIIRLSTLSVLEDPSASVQETAAAMELEVFPNPAGGKIRLRSEEPGTGTIRIFSVDGRLVKTIENSYFSTEIDVEELVPGYYLLQAEGKNSTGVKRFLKK